MHGSHLMRLKHKTVGLFILLIGDNISLINPDRTVGFVDYFWK